MGESRCPGSQGFGSRSCEKPAEANGQTPHPPNRKDTLDPETVSANRRTLNFKLVWLPYLVLMNMFELLILGGWRKEYNSKNSHDHNNSNRHNANDKGTNIKNMLPKRGHYFDNHPYPF